MRALADHRSSGWVPNDGSLLWVEEQGDPAGTIDIRPVGGVALRVHVNRGLDLGQAWYGGHPLAWMSAVGETGPLSELKDRDWTQAFGGGLMVTCGLRNVGMPAEGHGLHGTFNHLPARDVEVRSEFGDGSAYVEISGVIVDAEDPGPLVVKRMIRTHAGKGLVEIRDVTTNRSDVPVETPLLYHCNFGYPLWGPGAELDLDSSRVVPRDDPSLASVDDWRLPHPPAVTDERVLEHSVAVDEGWSRATISNRDIGIEVVVSWNAEGLPRFHQWIDPNPGMCVLGLEPANCSTSGLTHDRSEGRLPTLAPGHERETELTIESRLV